MEPQSNAGAPQGARPDFRTPQGATSSDMIAASALAIPPGMRELTPEEEATAIPLPQRGPRHNYTVPDWLPQRLNLEALPPEMRDEYVHSDLVAAADESALATGSLDEVMDEIRKEVASAPAAQPSRRSSFAQVQPPVPQVAPAPDHLARTYDVRGVAQPMGAPDPRYTMSSSAIPAYQTPYPQQPVEPMMAPDPRYRPIPTPPPPVNAPAYSPRPEAGKPIHHPVFDSLLRDFGIKQDTRSRTYRNHTFSFRQYNADQHTHCVSLADSFSSSPIEYGERLHQNIVCVSLVAIDGHPLFEILGEDVSNYRILDPMNPPSVLSIRLLERVRQMFSEQFEPDVIGDLWEIYDGLFPVAGESDDDLGLEGELWRYKCPKDGCSYSVDTIPKVDEHGIPVRHFCKNHPETELFPIGLVKDLQDRPLA